MGEVGLGIKLNTMPMARPLAVSLLPPGQRGWAEGVCWQTGTTTAMLGGGGRGLRGLGGFPTPQPPF